MTPKKTSLKRVHSPDVNSTNNSENDHVEFSDEEGGIRIDDIYIPPAAKPACSTVDTGPRLIITKIVNEWFKSYAGQQVVGPFHKRFNAIVGPNGSGKSNVIDSMLFVFGYRANRIRCKKVSTLLHNSEKFKNIQSCTVSVHFAQIIDVGGDIHEVIPNSEFVVSRTALKDNTSYYQLNGRKVQFKEIAIVLRQHKIDLDHNRFLILQGEVEQIAMMKSKATNEHETGLLEYLEDIIGTSRYKVPLVKLMERVEFLNERRTDKLNRLKLIENDMAELKGPMEQAVEFLKLENSISLNKNLLYQKKIYELEIKKNEKDKEKETIMEEQKQCIDELESIAKSKSEKQDNYNNCLREFEALQKKRDMLKQAFEKANTKNYQLRKNMEQVNMSRKKYKQQLVTENKKLAELEALPEKSTQDIEELHEKEKQLASQKKELEEDKLRLLSTLNEDTKCLRERRQKLEPKLAELKSIVHETKSAFTIAESRLKVCRRSENEERRKFESLIEANETVKRTISEYTESIKTLKTKIPLTENSLRDANQQLDSALSRQRQMEQKKREQVSNLESCRMSMQASRSRGRILDSLMQQKMEGKCPGLFGRLGDLGAIDKKYDIAISTACGPLDNIVVDTVDTAQWCIEFLKKYNLGRATFIALDKQEHFHQAANSKIRTPENVFRLYDLVRVNDERVKTAFYYGLRDTLVANDLDQASRVAYGQQRFRVVTLEGSLIEMSGIMSGGGKTVCRGRMGQSVTVSDVQPEDIKNMESNLDQLEEDIRENNRQCALLDRQINTLRPELEKMKFELKKYVMGLESSRRQEPILQRELKVQENKCKSTKSNPEEVRKLATIVEEEKAAYEAASSEAAAFQEEVDRITNEINEKMSGRVKALDKKINDVTKMLTKVKSEITRLNVTVKSLDRNLAKCKEKIASLEEDITNAEDSLKRMKREEEEIEADGKQLLVCIEEIAVNSGNKEEDIVQFKQELAEFIKLEKKSKSSKIEVDQKLSSLNKTINEMNAHLHEWRLKRNGLKLHKIPFDPSTEMLELKTFTSEELKENDLKLLSNELYAKEQAHKNAKPNLRVIEDYKAKQEVYLTRSKELEEVTAKRNSMSGMYESLRSRRRDEFLNGFDIIRKKLKEMYQMITLGGDADFELVDAFDPFTEGVVFNVRPPKKSWKNITNLSGGEKTLSSLALVFALHYYKPSPLYVMDEIDAALDFKNVSIVGHYIKERTKNAQFVIISLRPNMFELADYLVGICKTNDCTESITIDPSKFEALEPNNNEDVQQDDNPLNQSDANVSTDEDTELVSPANPDNVGDEQVVSDSFEEPMDVCE